MTPSHICVYVRIINTNIYICIYYIHKTQHIYNGLSSYSLPITSLILFLILLIFFLFPLISSSTFILIYFEDLMLSLGWLGGFWVKIVYNSVGTTPLVHHGCECLSFPQWLLTDCKSSGSDGTSWALLQWPSLSAYGSFGKWLIPPSHDMIFIKQIFYWSYTCNP